MVTNFFKKLVGKKSEAQDRTSASADEPTGNWITYKRMKEDGYWVVIVNQSLLTNNQIASMSWFVLEYHFQSHQLVNGMMPRPELSAVYYGLEDKIEAEIAVIGGKMAASQGGFGTRKVWYCAPNLRLEQLLRNNVQAFAEIPAEVTLSSYPQFASLIPSRLESQLAGNERIIGAIAQHGDDGSAERSVMHWITGFDQGAASNICSALKSLDYEIEETSAKFIRFSRVTSLSIESASEETENLIAFCEAMDCHYDGWETPVIRPSVH